jgi:hypothetical protein
MSRNNYTARAAALTAFIPRLILPASLRPITVYRPPATITTTPRMPWYYDLQPPPIQSTLFTPTMSNLPMCGTTNVGVDGSLPSYPCDFARCSRICKTARGLKVHIKRVHNPTSGRADIAGGGLQQGGTSHVARSIEMSSAVLSSVPLISDNNTASVTAENSYYSAAQVNRISDAALPSMPTNFPDCDTTASTLVQIESLNPSINEHIAALCRPYLHSQQHQYSAMRSSEVIMLSNESSAVLNSPANAPFCTGISSAIPSTVTSTTVSISTAVAAASTTTTNFAEESYASPIQPNNIFASIAPFVANSFADDVTNVTTSSQGAPFDRTSDEQIARLFRPYLRSQHLAYSGAVSLSAVAMPSNSSVALPSPTDESVVCGVCSISHPRVIKYAASIVPTKGDESVKHRSLLCYVPDTVLVPPHPAVRGKVHVSP